MSHHCDRCRAEYDSGAFYGGHDYCSLCYVRIMEDEKQKRRDEEKRKEREKQYLIDKRREEMARKEERDAKKESTEK